MDDPYCGGVFTYGGDGVTTEDENIIYTYLALLLISIANITIIYHVISGDMNIYWNILLIIIFIVDILLLGLLILMAISITYAYYNYNKYWKEPK